MMRYARGVAYAALGQHAAAEIERAHFYAALENVPADRLIIDIIANNPIDQKVVELCPSQHYSLVEHSMYRSVFPPQGVENGVFLPASP